MVDDIPVHVRSVFSEKAGTTIISQSEIDYKKVVTGIAYSKNDAKVTLVGVADKPGIAAAIFEPLGKSNIKIGAHYSTNKKPIDEIPLEIAEIKLVGAVLGHEQTPNLNQESADGRVQFFQLSFQDGKTKKVSSKNWKKWLIWLMIAVVVFLGMTSMFLIASRFSLLSLNSSKKSVSVCSTNRQEAKYSEHLRDIRKSLVFELNRLPAWSTFNVARTYCIGGKMSIKQQEQRLLQCLLKVRNRTKNMPPASRPSLNKIEACASTLCQRELPHLSEFCKRL